MIDEAMGDEVRVTVIAAGFDRWDEGKGREPQRRSASGAPGEDEGRRDRGADLFGESDDDAGDDFDVPSFLK